MAKRSSKRKPRQKSPEPAVNPFAARHGDYRTTVVVDLTGELGGKRQSMVRLLVNRKASTVDRWLFEGGPGFEEPQARAIEHCRGLWRLLGGSRLVANYKGVAAGQGDREGYLAALAQLGSYQNEFPRYVWDIFENVVRHDMPAGTAGSAMANNTPQAIAHAKACVGFVASKIAEWRGY